MKNKYILILLFLIYTTGISAQSYKFEILVKGDHIGTIEGDIDTTGNMIKVNIVALAEAHFIIDERVKYQLNSIYKNGELYFSSATIFLNGDPHFSSVVRKDGPYYMITKNEHKSMFTEMIDYSGSLLYFMEPTNRSEIFSEIDNIEKPITYEGDSVYKIVNPKNGYVSYFTYEDGILKTAKIHHTYIDIEIRRIQ